MFKIWLVITSALFMVLTVCIALTQLLSPDTMQILPFNPPRCYLPCILGITPGVTALDESLNILAKFGPTEYEAYPIMQDGINIYASPFFLENYYRAPKVSIMYLNATNSDSGKITTFGQLLRSGHTVNRVFRHNINGPNMIFLLTTFDPQEQIFVTVIGSGSLSPSSPINQIFASAIRDVSNNLDEVTSQQHFTDQIPWLGFASVDSYLNATPIP